MCSGASLFVVGLKTSLSFFLTEGIQYPVTSWGLKSSKSCPAERRRIDFERTGYGPTFDFWMEGFVQSSVRLSVWCSVACLLAVSCCCGLLPAVGVLLLAPFPLVNCKPRGANWVPRPMFDFRIRSDQVRPKNAGKKPNGFVSNSTSMIVGVRSERRSTR